MQRIQQFARRCWPRRLRWERDWSLETCSCNCVTIVNVVTVRHTILAFIGGVCPMSGCWGAPAWRVSWSSSSGSSEHTRFVCVFFITVCACTFVTCTLIKINQSIIAVSTSWRHLSDRVLTFTLCWDRSYEAEGRVQLCGAMSALVDLPGVANPQKADWCLVEGCVSGLVMDQLQQDVPIDKVVSLC